MIFSKEKPKGDICLKENQISNNSNSNHYSKSDFLLEKYLFIF